MMKMYIYRHKVRFQSIVSFMCTLREKDIEKLIPEYEGTSVDDYPGDNSVYVLISD